MKVLHFTTRLSSVKITSNLRRMLEAPSSEGDISNTYYCICKETCHRERISHSLRKYKVVGTCPRKSFGLVAQRPGKPVRGTDTLDMTKKYIENGVKPATKQKIVTTYPKQTVP